MKKWLPLLLLLLTAGSLKAQQITITGTVLDPNGNPYQMGSGRAVLVPGNVGWTTNNGYPVNQTTFLINNMDGFGRFSINIPSTLIYDQQSSNPQYQFSFCSVGYPSIGQICFTMTPLTLTTSQDISTQIRAQSALLPTTPSGGNSISINGVNIPNTNLQDSATVTLSVSSSNVQLNASPAIEVNGTSVPNANFVDNSSVTFTQSLGQIVANAISSVFTGGTVSGSTTFLSNLYQCGPNMWIDITCPAYGGRAVTTAPTATASCNGSTTINVTGISGTFQNGDGITIPQCGATNTLSTPIAPVVTAVVAKVGMGTGDVAAGLTGSTPYSYYLIGRTKGQGLTAGGAVGTLTTGAATLGPVATTSATFTRSNNQTTVTTSAPTGIAAGGIAFIAGANPVDFSGIYHAATITDSTHFIINEGIDTRAGGGVATSGTSGTVTVYNANHLTIPTAAYQYYVCNGTTNAFMGIVRPGETGWDDFGQAAPSRPAWMPATCPTSATNDSLSTTIVSGAPLGPFIVANAATQTITGQAAIFDDGPALGKCYTTASTSPLSSTCHWPAVATGTTYPINSYVGMTGGLPVKVVQEGPITLNDTIATPSNMWWDGLLGGGSLSTPAFSWGPGQIINIGTAFPGIAADSISARFSNIAFSAPANGLMVTVGPGGGFDSTFDWDSFNIPGGADTMGMAIVGYGASNISLNYDSFVTNDSGGYGYSLTPMVFFRNDVSNSNGSGDAAGDHIFCVGRCMAWDSSPAVGAGAHYIFTNAYAQGLRTPFITLGSLNGPYVSVCGWTNDTSITAVIDNLGANGMSAHLCGMTNNSSETFGPPGLVTGDPIQGLTGDVSATNIGQNMNADRQLSNVVGTQIAGSTIAGSLRIIDESVHVGPAYSLFFPANPPTGVTFSGPTSGGSVPVGGPTITYQVDAVGIDGRKTVTTSATGSCTTSAGNQTCTVVWNADGMKHNVYRNNSGLLACLLLAIGTNTCVDTASAAGNGTPAAITTTGTTAVQAQSVITPLLTLNNSAGTNCGISPTANTCPTPSGTVSGTSLTNGETAVGTGGSGIGVSPFAVYASKFAGSDNCAKIQAAITAVASTGGTVYGDFPNGNSTCAAAFTVTEGVHVILSNQKLIVGATVLVRASAGLVGDKASFGGIAGTFIQAGVNLNAPVVSLIDNTGSPPFFWHHGDFGWITIDGNPTNQSSPTSCWTVQAAGEDGWIHNIGAQNCAAPLLEVDGIQSGTTFWDAITLSNGTGGTGALFINGAQDGLSIHSLHVINTVGPSVNCKAGPGGFALNFDEFQTEGFSVAGNANPLILLDETTSNCHVTGGNINVSSVVASGTPPMDFFRRVNGASTSLPSVNLWGYVNTGNDYTNLFDDVANGYIVPLANVTTSNGVLPVGWNLSPVARQDAAVALAPCTLTATNGANNNFLVTAVGTSGNGYACSHVMITGPTGAFNITGLRGFSSVLTGAVDGQIVYIENHTGQVMTISNLNSGSTAANQITTGSGSDYAVSVGLTAMLMYNVAAATWYLIRLA